MTNHPNRGRFIGYTVGLDCLEIEGSRPVQLIKVEYSRNSDGVKLQAVSGRNLEAVGAQYSKTITREEFEARPRDAYDNIVEARWALREVGFVPAALYQPE